jgi:hypothetical protein
MGPPDTHIPLLKEDNSCSIIYPVSGGEPENPTEAHLEVGMEVGMKMG